MITTLDRQSADYALLCLSTGEVYDVYGSDWTELCEEAAAVAAHIGVEIEVFNSEIPEA